MAVSDYWRNVEWVVCNGRIRFRQQLHSSLGRTSKLEAWRMGERQSVLEQAMTALPEVPEWPKRLDEYTLELPEIVGPELAQRLRDDYGISSAVSDEDVLAQYDYGDWKYADTWDHLGDARNERDRLADAAYYERARADAAMARLRVAVEALNMATLECAECDGQGQFRSPVNPVFLNDCLACADAREALALIGDLP